MKIAGCDLYAKQQTIAVADSDTGEFTEKTLRHEGNALREFRLGLMGKFGNCVLQAVDDTAQFRESLQSA